MRVKCHRGYLSILDHVEQMDSVRRVVHFLCYTVDKKKTCGFFIYSLCSMNFVHFIEDDWDLKIGYFRNCQNKISRI